MISVYWNSNGQKYMGVSIHQIDIIKKWFFIDFFLSFSREYIYNFIILIARNFSVIRANTHTVKLRINMRASENVAKMTYLYSYKFWSIDSNREHLKNRSQRVCESQIMKIDSHEVKGNWNEIEISFEQKLFSFSFFFLRCLITFLFFSWKKIIFKCLENNKF
jgi:hypothetical protein